MKKLGLFTTEEKGATAVEFAIVFPLFIAMLLGTFELGMSMYERAKVSAAIAEGARAVSIYGDDEAKVKAAMLAAVPEYMREGFQIKYEGTTFNEKPFKKITVEYSHDLLIGLGKYMSDISMTSVRYTPVLKVAQANETTAETQTN